MWVPSRRDLPPPLLALIQSQCGAVLVSQCLDHGVTPRQLERLERAWTGLGHGLYIVGSLTWDAMAHAALLHGGSGAVLGGTAACFRHSLVTTPPATITVWAPRGLASISFGSWRIRPRRGVRSSRGSVPITSVETSLLDHASEASETSLIEAVTRAFATSRTTPKRLREACAQRYRVSHRRLLVELCESEGIESVLEWRYRKLVHMPHGLPKAEYQATSATGSRFDGLFRDYGVALELDGRSFHSADRDALRDNRHALSEGIVTLRFTWHQVMRQPCAVAWMIGQALERRGWSGKLRRCPRCS